MRLLMMALLLSLAASVSGQQAPTPASTSSTAAPSDVAAPPADAAKTKSGLATKVIQPGTGKRRPSKDDVVTVDYTGWTTDGKLFDSSIPRGQPSTFPVNGVIAGFGEGLQLMTVGETRRLWIPESLAYKGKAGAPAGMLVFDVTLRSIPTAAPDDVKAPPKDAERTASGLEYKVLKPGTGTRHPKSSDQVTVHYTGWTTDGKTFDSSLRHGQPATFRVDEVIPGWSEGVQLMVEGQKMRFWIPQILAYQGRQAPYGMLVFDVELLSIK